MNDCFPLETPFHNVNQISDSTQIVLITNAYHLGDTLMDDLCKDDIFHHQTLTLTLVSLYRCGRIASKRSLTSDGLLCAAELNVTSETRRTLRSGSFIVSKKS